MTNGVLLDRGNAFGALSGKHRPFELGQSAWIRALQRTAPLPKHPERTFPVVIEELAAQFGERVALISHRESFTYYDLSKRANRYSRWILEQDLAPGTVVGLMMPNRPEYLAIWLGVVRMGCVAALLNTNLVGASLAHCIDAAGVQHLIVADCLASAIEAALPDSKLKPKVWVHGEQYPGFFRIDTCVGRFSGKPLEDRERRLVTIADQALYIYTSGTTGLPKAAKISHHRILAWCNWFAGMMDTQPDDRLYNCLPFYHSIGGVTATGALLLGGGSVFVKEKFSASSFWKDIRENECTVFQYIGELCRYLLKAPESPDEHLHNLRLCCGNGLGGDIWPEFKSRFQIPHILEFFAATEANFSLYNMDEEPGALGRIPPFLAHRFPIKLIKMDADALQPVRNDEGLCIQAASNEPGEAIFRIAQEAGSGPAAFEGYTNARDSDKKILCDVVKKGDAWFRSGDLMRKNEAGFFYFVDRIGDTFRWKGENVSAAEVMHAIAACPGVSEAMVYGVTVPNAAGRAGAAALSVDGSFDLAKFKDHLDRRLPRYAQPLFLRFIGTLQLTSTFRPQKSSYAAQGFDPKSIEDELYLNDHGRGEFVKLEEALYEDIAAGRLKL
ncbi:MAG: long-chain-acyl-CoA synthetase [Rhodomicrobium sp.]